MQADLGLSTVELGWVVTAYTLAFGGCLLAAGRLADRVGRRRAFAAGLVLFALASLACGLAPTGGVLLAARAVQGLGAALVSPAALALLTDRRPGAAPAARALGWWTAAAAGGGASGWVLGGVLSGLLGWRWVFLVNVPVCVVAAARSRRACCASAAARARAAPTSPARRSPRPGSRRSCSRLTSPRPGPGASAHARARSRRRRAARCARAVEARAADPLLDRALLRRSGVAEPNTVAAVLTATTTPPMFLCTLHAQDVLGLAPGPPRACCSRRSTSR